jgi:hypothetical protein
MNVAGGGLEPPYAGNEPAERPLLHPAYLGSLSKCQEALNPQLLTVKTNVKRARLELA